MIKIKSFTFNAFQENTYVLSDDTKDCVIIDPGCSNKNEQDELVSYISQQGLNPVRLLNTHCHIDHILGNAFVASKYKLGLEICEKELPVLHYGESASTIWGIPYELSPMPSKFIGEADVIKFGESELSILFTPGHSPGSICFINEQQKFAIVGDVLFYGSIGRTDLPMGHHQTLIDSILNKLMPLANDVKVYSGHGPATTIGNERTSNPFLQ